MIQHLKWYIKTDWFGVGNLRIIQLVIATCSTQNAIPTEALTFTWNLSFMLAPRLTTQLTACQE